MFKRPTTSIAWRHSKLLHTYIHTYIHTYVHTHKVVPPPPSSHTHIFYWLCLGLRVCQLRTQVTDMVDTEEYRWTLHKLRNNFLYVNSKRAPVPCSWSTKCTNPVTLHQVVQWLKVHAYLLGCKGPVNCSTTFPSSLDCTQTGQAQAYPGLNQFQC